MKTVDSFEPLNNEPLFFFFFFSLRNFPVDAHFPTRATISSSNCGLPFWLDEWLPHSHLWGNCRESTMKSASKMSSLHNEPSYDLIHTDCHHTLPTPSLHHQSINQRNDAQTHSISTAKQPKCASHDKSVVKRGRTLDKSSDFLQWHKTKLKANSSSSNASRWQLTHRVILVITIVLFASLSDILICVAHASDVTSLVQRVNDDDDKSNNQKYTDIGITTDPLVRDGAAASASSRNNPALYSNLDKFGSNLEMSIAAVFNKVAYGTTTKRSISDVFVPNLTTVPTPQLTTFR